MYKFLALIAAGYLAYRWLVKPSLKANRGPVKEDPAGAPGGEDEMVQDPLCGVYFPESEGFVAKVDGRRMVFCSDDCRQAYIARYKVHEKK